MSSSIRDNQASVVYRYEVGSNSSSTTYSAKIGMMYVSDYGYGTTLENWSTNLSDYSGAIENNWLYWGLLSGQ